MRRRKRRACIHEVIYNNSNEQGRKIDNEREREKKR